MQIDVDLLSNEELLAIVDELQNITFEKDSIVRVLAKQYFGSDSLPKIVLLPYKLLPIVSKRLKEMM